MKQILHFYVASLAALFVWAVPAGAQDEAAVENPQAQDSYVTTAVSVIDADALTERTSSFNILQGMAGKAAGVKIVSTSGRPGGNPYIQIRGINSLQGNSAPLYVVDGIVGVDPDILNANDIESVSILKDAAATAIYGARGGNGVVLITTKSGKSADGHGTVTYDGRVGVGYFGTTVKLMNSEQFMGVQKQAYAYSGSTMPQLTAPMENLFSYPDGTLGSATPLYDTDWQKESTRTAVTHSHNVSFSQASDDSKVYAGIGWQNVQGVLKETWADRVSGTIKASTQVKPWLGIRGIVSFARTQDSHPDNEGSAKQNALRAMYEAAPIIPVKYPEGGWGHMDDYPSTGAGSNPVEQLTNLKNKDLNQSVIGNIGADFTILPGLTFTAEGSVQTSQFKNTDFTPADIYDFASADTGTQAYITYANTRKYESNNYLTYKYDAEDYSAKLVLGMALTSLTQDYNILGAQKMSTDLFEHYNMGVGTQKVMPVSDYSHRTLHSYYLSTSQVFKGKYIVDAALRIDGGKAFDTANKYEWYPSVSAAWLLSEEPIFDGIRDKVNLVKLRAGVGRAGNLSDNVLFWETSASVDAGIDISAFDSRVNLTADVYARNVNLYPGFNTLHNNGLEISLTATPVKAGDFTWDLGVIYYTNNVYVGQFYSTQSGHGLKSIRDGAIDKWHMNEFQGVWGTAEAGAAAAAGAAAGDYKFGAAKLYGNVLPKGDASLVTSFNWKGLTLMADFGAAWGFQVANMTKGVLVSQAGEYNSYASVYGATWTPANQSSAIAQRRLPSDSGYYDGDMGSYVLENGDFIRVRNIALSYEFPKALLDKTKVIKGLTLGASIENPVIWTKYNGIDPEAGFGQSFLNLGYDTFAYPKPTTVSGHIKLSF